jgi:uncharacterized protein (UPF0276 family)
MSDPIIGLGWRQEFFKELERDPSLPLQALEIHSENYFNRPMQQRLLKLRADYPISMHGVGLGLGAWDKPDALHLAQVKQLNDVLEPWMVSEHLACTHQNDIHVPELLPLVYSHGMLLRVADWVELAQNTLGRPIALEHLSRYLPRHADSDYTEMDFLAELCRRTGCGVLLDLNNLHLNEINLSEAMEEVLQHVPWGQVWEIHVAGVTHQAGTYQLDLHNAPVHPKVRDCWQNIVKQHPHIPTILEWDQDFPVFPDLLNEITQLRLLSA